MSQIDEVKNRIDVVDLIRGYIEIKKAGANWKALCPFHSEKTGSFMISPDKQIWHCFGCGEGGDIFGFVTRMEGMEFRDALGFLAKKAGVKLTRQDPKITSQITKLGDVLEAATMFYSSQLKENKEVIDYLKDRGLTGETAKQFRLGVAPDGWNGLTNYLKGKNFTDKDMILAGLAMQKDSSSNIYDRFRGRLMFPIMNHFGNVVGFTARVLPSLDDGKTAKYINTPETTVYKKSSILYGLNFAKQSIRKMDCAVLVEGNMDVISLHQAGFVNTVATSGTALTVDQVGILKRHTNNILISFDADSAGVAAAFRGIDIALAKEMNIKVVEMPKDSDGELIAKDPDELIKKDPELWKKAVSEAKHIVDFYISTYQPNYKLVNPDENARFCKIILDQVSKLRNSLEKSFWIKKLSKLTGAPEHILLADIKSANYGSPKSITAKPEIKQKRDSIELKYLALLLGCVDNLKPIIEQVPVDIIKIDQAREFYRHFVLYYNDRGSFSLDDFKDWYADLGQDSLILEKILLYKDKEYSDNDPARINKELRGVVLYFKDKYIKEQRNIIMQEMIEAEAMQDEVKIKEILQKFKNLDNA